MSFIRKTDFATLWQYHSVLLLISGVNGWVSTFYYRGITILHSSVSFSDHTKSQSSIIRNMSTHQTVELTLHSPMKPSCLTCTSNIWLTLPTWICTRASFSNRMESMTWNYWIVQLICANFIEIKVMSRYYRWFTNWLNITYHNGLRIVLWRK